MIFDLFFLICLIVAFFGQTTRDGALSSVCTAGISLTYIEWWATRLSSTTVMLTVFNFFATAQIGHQNKKRETALEMAVRIGNSECAAVILAAMEKGLRDG